VPQAEVRRRPSPSAAQTASLPRRAGQAVSGGVGAASSYERHVLVSVMGLVEVYVRRIGIHDPDLGHEPLRRCSQALFRWLLLDPVAAICNGNDPEWCRYICGTEERCVGQVIGEILIDATQRVLG